MPANQVDVALPIPVHSTFTYSVDGPVPVEGTRVLVPFRKEERVGWVVGSGPEADMRNVRTVLDEAYRDATLAVEVVVRNRRDEPVRHHRVELTLLDEQGQVVLASPPSATVVADGGAKVSVALEAPVANPKKWSAEQPHLYRLLVTLEDEAGRVLQVERCSVGFRHIEVKDGQVK